MTVLRWEFGMSSRYSILILLLFILGSGFFLGCSIGEPRRVSEPQSVESRSELGCIKTFPDTLKTIVDGQGAVSDINTLESCALKGVEEFQKLTKGHANGEFNPKEFRNFAQKYFLGDFNISDRLLELGLRFKAVYLGGGIEKLNGEDLQAASRSLKVLFSVLRSFHPYLPLKMESLKNLSLDQNRKLQVVLIESAQAINGLLNGQSLHSFNFSELRELLGEINVQLKADGKLLRLSSPDETVIDSILENLRLIQKFKEAFLEAKGGDFRSVSRSELELTVTEGVKLLGMVLTIQNVMNRDGLNLSREGSIELFSSVKSFLQFLDRAVERNQTKNGIGLPLEKLQKIVLEPVLEFSGAKFTIRGETVSGLLGTLGSRLLGQEHRELRNVTMIRREHITQLHRVLREWMVLKAWNDQKEGDSGALVSRERLTEDSVQSQSTLQKKLPFTLNSEEKAKLMEWKSFLKGNPALYLPDRSPHMETGMNRRFFSRFELNLFSILRPTLGALMRGYVTISPTGGPRAEAHRGITMSEFEIFVNDIWNLLIEFRFLSRLNIPTEDAAKRFREGSLFVYSSDGDPWLGVGEASQLILYLAEAKGMGNKATALAKEKCRQGPPDEFSVPLIEPKCFRKTVFNFDNESPESVNLWSDFPKLREYYTGLSEKERAEFQFLLEIPGRELGYQESVWFNSEDTETVVALVRYIETIFDRFDTNPRNGTLGPLEAKFAFPLFQRELAGFQPGLDPKTLYSAFTWLLAFGGEPVTDQMGPLEKAMNLAKFGAWRVKGDSRWKFESTRRNLVSVFGVITQAAAKTAAEAARELDAREQDAIAAPRNRR